MCVCVCVCVLQALGGLAYQAFYQRILAASSYTQAQVTCFASSAFCLVLGIPSILIGAVAASTGTTDRLHQVTLHQVRLHQVRLHQVRLHQVYPCGLQGTVSRLNADWLLRYVPQGVNTDWLSSRDSRGNSQIYKL